MLINYMLIKQYLFLLIPSDAVKNDVVKKDVEDKTPDITNLATNTTLNAKINEVNTTTAINAEINEVKNKTPNITNLATTTTLTAVENEIPDHSKYITTPEFSKLTTEILLQD